jgi:flavin-dependent dehydrogenase
MVCPAYDVAILGGGPAGAAAAIALRRRGALRVLVVEAQGDGAIRVGESVPPETRALLSRLGVWEDFLRDAHEPCLGSCSSWGDDELGYNDFLFNPHGTGWHLDRRRFDALLADKAREAGAELRTDTRFEGSMREDGEGFSLRLRAAGGDPEEVRARFVVDATGSGSRFARAMGRRQIVHDRLSCVAAFMDLPAAAPLSRLTMLEAVPYGYWYAARLPGGRAAVAVASDPEIVQVESLHTEARFLARLRETRHIAGEIEGARLEGGLVARPAISFILDRADGDGWLAVGDAASAYDPLASQGIYKALLDALGAADTIAARLGGGGAPGDHHASVAARFADYLRNRRHFYDVERRFWNAPFWQRRRSRSERAAPIQPALGG